MSPHRGRESRCRVVAEPVAALEDAQGIQAAPRRLQAAAEDLIEPERVVLQRTEGPCRDEAEAHLVLSALAEVNALGRVVLVEAVRLQAVAGLEHDVVLRVAD